MAEEVPSVCRNGPGLLSTAGFELGSIRLPACYHYTAYHVSEDYREGEEGREVKGEEGKAVGG